jgi:PAS domain S-box-containing protein
MIVQTSSGERRFWEYNNTLRTEGVSLPIVRGMAQDITERKRAEEEAREQQAYFQQLFESSPEGILILDEKGRILAANKGFEKIFQYHIEEIRAHYVDELIVPPEHSDEASAVLEAILRGEVVQKESVRSRKDGNRVDVVLIGYPIVLNGKVLGTYMIYSDISARKRAEETLRRSEVMSAMGSLVGAVAHEVRNPLFCISSTLDAFEARFGAREEYQRYTAILRGELNRLTELMQELLDYGRPPELERSASAIQDVIAQAISSCEPLLERSKVSVSNTIGTQLAPLLVDRRRLQQVFQNLIDNSIRHSPSGAVVLLEAEEVHQDNQIWLECSVKDSGPGFKAEDLSRVFEPFFTRRRGGTGLGLSIVQRIVEQHGGKISAANRPEGGAVMTVKLPLFAE